MSLTLKSKAVFEYDDGISKTTIPLSPEDDLETTITKLRKVIELVKPEPGEAERIVAMGVKSGFMKPQEAVEHLKRTEEPPVSSGGWHKAPEPPEHWQGEVEVIPEEET